MESSHEPAEQPATASSSKSDSPPPTPSAEPLGVPPDAVEQTGIIPDDVAPDQGATIGDRVKTVLVGKPRDLSDRSIYHALSLAALFAWVGLGADGLSSSAYGPAEAFATLVNSEFGDHAYLAILLAVATALTVFVISACYSHIIEEFPTGGGGYLVASKLLGPRIGVISGCALLVDYALTITTSCAAAGDAVFGLLGPEWRFAGVSHHETKLLVEFAVI